MNDKCHSQASVDMQLVTAIAKIEFAAEQILLVIIINLY